MNNTDSSLRESGNVGASALDSNENTDGMKRAAAKQLIEAYYFQLTDGCGNSGCSNDTCASSPSFRLKNEDKNALALMSIELFKQKAQLCENQRSKIARLPGSEESSPSSASSSSAAVTPDSGRKVPPSAPPDGLTVFPMTSQAVTAGPSSASGATPKTSPTTPTKSQEINFLDEEKLNVIITSCRESNDWSCLIKAIGSVFSNPESLIKSFQKQSGVECGGESVVKQSKEDKVKGEIDADKDIDSEEMETSQSEQIEQRIRRTCLETNMDINVDIESLHRSFEVLQEIPDLPFQNALINALRSLAKTLDMEFRYSKQIEYTSNYLNIFVIVLEIPFLHSPEYIESAFPDFCKSMGHLPLKGQVKLAKFWASLGLEKVQDMVTSLQQLITVKLIDGESRWNNGWYLNNEDAITGPIKVMKILYYASMYGGQTDSKLVTDEEKNILESESQLQHEFLGASAMGADFKEPRLIQEDPLAVELGVNHVDCQKPLVPFEDFVNETLNEYISVETDYKYKLESEDSPDKFSFANYSFVLNTASKQASLYMDNRIQMFKERRSSIFQTLLHGMPPMPYLRIRVSRERIIDDALVALEMVAMENPSDLRKQLFVEFDGEQGLDEGGVSKEFFQLIIEEIFNIDFGMFTYNNDTHQFWFNSMSFENDGQFTLIGIVLGLAIYNSTIVDVHFPPVVYRKLLGKLGTFQDLAGVDPTLAKNLQEMLDYEGDDLEEVFMQSFQISYQDVFGCTITHSLKDKGEDLPVTQKNKQEFVDLYADFILNKSIEKQFRAFRRGFQMVTSESPLKTLFRPSEIELLICGSKNFDFFALEEACEYDGGFDKQSDTIKHFWDIVHSFSDEQKRQLLQFTTGTDRVPVGGLAKLKLIIARNGPDSERLPTAHTCFNVLLLPDYENREKLEERLLKAITYSKGFGML